MWISPLISVEPRKHLLIFLFIFFSFSLSISGKKVRAIIPPVEARSRNSGTPSTQSSEYSHLEEEIFEKEGEYEEIIAVDYKDM